jgi:hypothetical protein
MSCDLGVVMLGDDASAKVCDVWYIDASSEVK